jgi:hypothetical protein
MPESELFRWVVQGGAVTVLVWMVWAFMTGKVYPAASVLEKTTRILALEGKLVEKDTMIASLMTELQANIRAQEVASHQQELASQLVDPAVLKKIMEGIQDGIRKSLKGTR